jgi:hypothetical protein
VTAQASPTGPMAVATLSAHFEHKARERCRAPLNDPASARSRDRPLTLVPAPPWFDVLSARRTF